MNDKTKPETEDEKKKHEHEKKEDRQVTIADEDSFPASDSPPWTMGRTRKPTKDERTKK